MENNNWTWSPSGHGLNPDWKARHVTGQTSRHICTLVLPSLQHNIPEQDTHEDGVRSTTDNSSAASFSTKGASATFGDVAKQKSSSLRTGGNVRLGLSCDPLIAFGKYVLAATTNAHVCIYSLVDYSSGLGDVHDENDDQNNNDWENNNNKNNCRPLWYQDKQDEINKGLSPKLIIGPFGIRDDNDNPSMIVAMDTTKIGDRLFLILLMAEGDLIFLEFKNVSAKVPTVQFLTCVPTLEVGPTCFCFISSLDSNSLRIAVGYESGKIIDIVVSFKVPSPTKTGSSPRPTTTSKGTTKSNRKNLESRRKPTNPIVSQIINWRGSFQSSIRSLQSIKDTNTHHNNNDISQNLLLAVGITGLKSGTEPVSNLIKVINLSEVEHAFHEKFTGITQRELFRWQNKYHIPIDSFGLWPDAGREIKEIIPTLTTSSDNFRPIHEFIHATNKSCSFTDSDGSSGMAFSTTNGTVAVLHPCNSDTDKRLTWGVVTPFNQMRLQQPSIGLGVFNSSHIMNFNDDHENNQSTLKHNHSVACCLRGGTVFVFPVLSQNKNKSLNWHNLSHTEHNVTMYTYPLDSRGNEDSIVRFIQNFTAGYVEVDEWTRKHTEVKNSFPNQSTKGRIQAVMLRVLHSGIIDVHSCDVLEYTRDDNSSTYFETSDANIKQEAIDQALNNGMASDLYQFILALDESTEEHLSLLDIPIWKLAKDECSKIECNLNENGNKNLIEVIKSMDGDELKSFIDILCTFLLDDKF